MASSPPSIPPFITDKLHPGPKSSLDTRGMLSIATMFVSLASLSVSLFGAGRLVLDIFNDGLVSSLDGMPLKIVVVSFSFLFGWITALVCIRGFGNLIYPMIIKMYAWFCLTAAGLLYIMVIQKLFLQAYDGAHFWAYLVILLGALGVLICLHLLVEGHDLRPFAIPLMIISVLHLFLIVGRYVFAANPNGLMLFCDLTIFGVMISISGLMLLHVGILSPLREEIGSLFTQDPFPDRTQPEKK